MFVQITDFITTLRLTTGFKFQTLQAQVNRTPLTTLSPLEQEIAWLRVALQNFPRWKEGHCKLAERALEKGDIATTYASVQAASMLRLSEQQDFRMQWCLARAHLARGGAENACAIFQKLIQKNPPPLLYEDYAAALMATGKNEEARLILLTHGKTVASKSVLEYLNRSNTESSQ